MGSRTGTGAIASQLTIDQAEQALLCVPAHDRETWVLMAMALKSEFGELAFDVWDGWSQSDDSYKPADARAVWRSVKPGGKTGIGSLIHAAQEYGFKLSQESLSDADRQRLNDEIEQRRRRVAAERQAYEAARLAWHDKVATAAQRIWDNLLQDSGVSEYIGRKRIRPFGIRFVSTSFVYVADLVHDQVDVITGADDIRAFFKRAKALSSDELSFRYCKRGAFVVPVVDGAGKLFNLQVIFASGAKKFLKNGRKQGCYHLVLQSPADLDHNVLLIAEGYATAASLYMATGFPVAICFDAGNLAPVANTLRSVYPNHQLIIAGDDDIDNPDNPGRTKSTQAAAAVGARVLFPQFRGGAA